MPQRQLRVTANNRELGAVAHDAAGPRFEGATARVFARVRAEQGDDAAAQALVADGWSNGYLYLDKPLE